MGKLTMRYSKQEDDMIVSYGEGCDRSDRVLLFRAMMSKVCVPDHSRVMGFTYEDGMLAELEKRGYDPKTLRFSIEKRNPQGGDDDRATETDK